MKFSYFFIYFFLLTTLASEIYSHHNQLNSNRHQPKEEKTENKSLIAAVITIFISGLGDKSFLITAFLSMQYSKLLVFSASFLSLTIMGFISIQFGKILPKYISISTINLCGGVLFIFIGIYLIINGYFSKREKENDDKEEIEKLINEDNNNNNPVINKSLLTVWFECFGLVFISELGDKSQIALICLSTNFPFIPVIIGFSIANFALTIIAIFCGKVVEERLSKNNLELISGFLFVIFGIFFIQTAFDTELTPETLTLPMMEIGNKVGSSIEKTTSSFLKPKVPVNILPK